MTKKEPKTPARDRVLSGGMPAGAGVQFGKASQALPSNCYVLELRPLNPPEPIKHRPKSS